MISQVLLGLPLCLSYKESACSAGDLGSIPGEGTGYPLWPREFHGVYSLWGHKESDMTEQLSLSLLGIINDKCKTPIPDFC